MRFYDNLSFDSMVDCVIHLVLAMVCIYVFWGGRRRAPINILILIFCFFKAIGKGCVAICYAKMLHSTDVPAIVDAIAMISNVIALSEDIFMIVLVIIIVMEKHTDANHGRIGNGICEPMETAIPPKAHDKYS